MTNNELLLAMSKLLDPIREDIREIKCDVSELKKDVAELKVCVGRLEEDVAELKEDVAVLKEDVAELKEDVAVLKESVAVLEKHVAALQRDMTEMQGRVKRIELSMETNISPRLQNIEACYTSTYDRYKNNVDDYDTMKQDISILKDVVTEHSERIQKIS